MKPGIYCFEMKFTEVTTMAIVHPDLTMEYYNMNNHEWITPIISFHHYKRVGGAYKFNSFTLTKIASI